MKPQLGDGLLGMKSLERGTTRQHGVILINSVILLLLSYKIIRPELTTNSSHHTKNEAYHIFAFIQTTVHNEPRAGFSKRSHECVDDLLLLVDLSS